MARGRGEVEGREGEKWAEEVARKECREAREAVSIEGKQPGLHSRAHQDNTALGGLGAMGTTQHKRKGE